MQDDKSLFRLHAEIDARVHAIRGDRPDWLCGKGCDSCCRRLAEVPQLSAAEWHLLQEGLSALGESRALTEWFARWQRDVHAATIPDVMA